MNESNLVSRWSTQQGKFKVDDTNRATVEKLQELSRTRKQKVEKIQVSEDAGVKRLQVTVDNVEPLTVTNIVDANGDLSKKVTQLAEANGVSVIPFTAAGIFEECVSLRDHDIVEHRGIRMASTRTVREEYIEEVRKSIYEAIVSGQKFQISLWGRVEIDGTEYDTLLLNLYELGTLEQLYKKYNSRVVITDDEDVILCVG